MALPDIRSQATRRTPIQLLEHLQSFRLEPKFSAGIWFFSPSPRTESIRLASASSCKVP